MREHDIAVVVIGEHLRSHEAVEPYLAEFGHHFGPVDVALQELHESVNRADVRFEVLQVHLPHSVAEDANPLLRIPEEHDVPSIQERSHL